LSIKLLSLSLSLISLDSGRFVLFLPRLFLFQREKKREGGGGSRGWESEREGDGGRIVTQLV